jgi:pimeloyl-ACP methyl ester carboxylesterase
MSYEAGNLVGNLMQIINPVTSAREIRYYREYVGYVLRELKRGNPQYEKGYKGLVSKIEENNRRGSATCNPILLVPGFWEDKAIYWDSILQYLRAEQTLHAYYLHLYSFRSIEENADKLVEIAEITREHTGAKKVDLIGHSMGGLVVTLASIKRPDLFGKCIALGAPLHGTLLATRAMAVFDRLPKFLLDKLQIDLGYDLVAVREMMFQSDFVQNAITRMRDNTEFQVHAFSIFSENDEAVIPWYSAVLDVVHNININRHLGKKFVGHIDLVYHPKMIKLIRSILDDNIDPSVYEPITFDECIQEAHERTPLKALSRGISRLPLFNSNELENNSV